MLQGSQLLLMVTRRRRGVKELLNQDLSGLQLVFRCHGYLLGWILTQWYSEFVFICLIRQPLWLSHRNIHQDLSWKQLSVPYSRRTTIHTIPFSIKEKDIGHSFWVNHQYGRVFIVIMRVLTANVFLAKPSVSKVVPCFANTNQSRALLKH